jgi:hypothetical protein
MRTRWPTWKVTIAEHDVPPRWQHLREDDRAQLEHRRIRPRKVREMGAFRSRRASHAAAGPLLAWLHDGKPRR